MLLFQISRKENCLILPLSALLEEGESTLVVVYDKGQAKFKNVQVGEKNNRIFDRLSYKSYTKATPDCGGISYEYRANGRQAGAMD